MLENFTETFRPDNRFKCLCDCEMPDDITINSTVVHTFIFPFKFDPFVKECIITYKQGLFTILTKSFSTDELINNMVEDENRHFLLKEDALKSYLILTLTPEDTSVFKENVLDTYVQVKIITIEDEVYYNSSNKLIVNKPISEPYESSLDEDYIKYDSEEQLTPENQEITLNGYYVNGKVNVSLGSTSITPTTSTQTVTPGDTFWSSVEIGPAQSVYEGIENAARPNDVSVGRVFLGENGLEEGNYHGGILQDKTVIYNNEDVETFEPDSGYDGFSSITVDGPSIQQNAVNNVITIE